jgi:hypothetical protein
MANIEPILRHKVVVIMLVGIANLNIEITNEVPGHNDGYCLEN